MAGATGFGIIVAAMAGMVALLGQHDIAGFSAQEAGTTLAFVAAALVITGRSADRARGGAGATAAALVLWCLSTALLWGLFSQRAVLNDVARALASSTGLMQPETIVGQGGEVTIVRRGGSFLVPARINDRDARFVFDTGASTVVLTHDTARALGLDLDKLGFRIPVGTANGVALAAPVTLDSVSVGPITLRRVQALVVRAGMLSENLLGMTFLERLASYEVRGNRLVFRAVRG